MTIGNDIYFAQIFILNMCYQVGITTLNTKKKRHGTFICVLVSFPPCFKLMKSKAKLNHCKAVAMKKRSE